MAKPPVRLRSYIPASAEVESQIAVAVMLVSEILLSWRGKSEIVPRVTLNSRIG